MRIRLPLAWMTATAAPSSNDRGAPSRKQKGKKKSNANEVVTYEPKYSLEDLLELRQNKDAFTMFVNHFLKPAYSTKWKAKRYEPKTKKVADIVTASDEAFVLLTLENNWERWIDINNKTGNAYTTSMRGLPSTLDSDVMPKYTHINKKRTDVARGDTAPQVWRGWNHEGILRFNDLCKEVKADRTNHAALDKTILAEIDPEEKSQRPKKRRKKLPPVPQAYVETSDDDDDSTESDDDDGSDSNNDNESKD